MANGYELGPPPPPPHPAANLGVFAVVIGAIAAGAWYYISQRDSAAVTTEPVAATAAATPSPSPAASPAALPTPSAAGAVRAPKPRAAKAAPPPATPSPVVQAAVEAAKQPAPPNPPPERVTPGKPSVPPADPRIYDAAAPDVTPPSLLTPIGIAPVRTNYVPGLATLEVIVSDDGSVQSAKAGRPPATVGETLEMMNWLAAAKSWRFGPAVKDGQSVNYRLVVPLSALVSGRGIR